jgi:hypothetical protein
MYHEAFERGRTKRIAHAGNIIFGHAVFGAVSIIHFRGDFKRKQSGQTYNREVVVFGVLNNLAPERKLDEASQRTKHFKEVVVRREDV